MNLSMKVTDLPPSVYWKAFFAFVFISIGSVVAAQLNIIDVLYAVAIGVIAFFLAVICLILRFPSAFEWIIDIGVSLLVVGHILTFISPRTAEYLLYIPGLNYLFVMILTGGWILLYPYVIYRVYRRFKPSTSQSH